MITPSVSEGRATVVADERVGTRLQAGCTLFARLMHQLEMSLDGLDSFLGAKEVGKGRADSGSDSSTPGPGRGSGSRLAHDTPRSVPTARTNPQLAASTVGLVSSGVSANINEAAARESALGGSARGGPALLPESDGAPGSGTWPVDRHEVEAARITVAAQVQPAIGSASSTAIDATQLADAGAQQGATAGSPSGAATKSVPRYPCEPANRPMVTFTSMPTQGTSVAIGLPRSSAQEVEEMRSRIAGEMARSGLTNYRLTINGADMKRTTPDGGRHGDR